MNSILHPVTKDILLNFIESNCPRPPAPPPSSSHRSQPPKRPSAESSSHHSGDFLMRGPLHRSEHTADGKAHESDKS